MPMHTLTLLHISDLHLKASEQSTWRRRRVLGEAWDQNLETLLEEGPPDLVCFTGDVAFAGKAEEYELATIFFNALLERLGLGLDRFFVIPGNHDIERQVKKQTWKRLRDKLLRANPSEIAKWLAGGATPLGFKDRDREEVLSRQEAYQRWVREDIRRVELDPSRSPHGRLGFRASVALPHLPFAIHIVGLDSAWACGDNHDTGKLWLTDEQVMRLASDDEGGALDGFRLALVHHPLEDLADAADARRLLAERVDLLLRGHLHETEPQTWADTDRTLQQVAAGCLYQDDRYPNACVLLRLTLDEAGRPLRYEARFRGWSKRGHWFDDDSLYKGSVRGELILWSKDQENESPPGPQTRVTPAPELGSEVKARRAASRSLVRRDLQPERWRLILLVFAVIVLSSILAVGLAQFLKIAKPATEPHSPPANGTRIHSFEHRASASKSATMPGGATQSNPIGFKEYYESIIRLDGRFLEKKEFSDQLVGAKITWDGYADSVTEMDENTMALMIRTSKKSRFFGEDFWQALVLFDKNWKTKLYSFRRLDKVRVIGVIRRAGVSPALDGLSVELLLDEPKVSGRRVTKADSQSK